MQTSEAISTVKDASELVRLLGKREFGNEDEQATMRILRDHSNPWQLGYLLAVIRGAGLEHVLDTFGFDTRDDLKAILASQAFTLKREFVGPADRIGLLEPMIREQKVRVLRPYGARASWPPRSTPIIFSTKESCFRTTAAFWRQHMQTVSCLLVRSF
jgi:hypothetical protein